MAPPVGEVSTLDPGKTEIQKRFISVYASPLTVATLLLISGVWIRAKISRPFWIDECKYLLLFAHAVPFR